MHAGSIGHEEMPVGQRDSVNDRAEPVGATDRVRMTTSGGVTGASSTGCDLTAIEASREGRPFPSQFQAIGLFTMRNECQSVAIRVTSCLSFEFL
jgi:hypothetical protein